MKSEHLLISVIPFPYLDGRLLDVHRIVLFIFIYVLFGWPTRRLCLTMVNGLLAVLFGQPRPGFRRGSFGLSTTSREL
jgi:hypothetical protein